MANVYATKNGNWSDTTVWNIGALPTGNDDVFANNFTVFIDTDITVLTLRTMAAAGINAGGVFTANNNITIRSNIIGGTTTCLQFVSAFPSSFTLIGNLSTNNAASTNTRSLLNNSTGTVYISGNVLGCSYNLSNASQSGIVDNRSTGSIFLTGSVQGYNGTENNAVGNFSNGTVTIYGNVSAGPSANANFAVHNGTNSNIGNTTGIVNIYGDIFSVGNIATVNNRCVGSTNIFGNVQGTGFGVANSNTPGGTVNIFGNITGGTSSNFQVQNGTNGTINIVGNITGGSGGGGVTNVSTGVINITGNVTGGSSSNVIGVTNTNLGTILINGTVTGGTNALGASNTNTGTLYVKRAKGNAFGIGSAGLTLQAGVNGAQTSLTYVSEIEYGDRGASPTTGNILLSSLPSNQASFYVYNEANKRTLTDPVSSSSYPPVSSVRSGVSYAAGNLTGTMNIPFASSVAYGVAVDNTVGTAVLTPDNVWGTLTTSLTSNSATLGYRLKDAATVQTVGNLIAAYNS